MTPSRLLDIGVSLRGLWILLLPLKNLYKRNGHMKINKRKQKSKRKDTYTGIFRSTPNTGFDEYLRRYLAQRKKSK